MNGRVVDCFSCNGSGIDESAWDGRCSFCRGRGQVDAFDDDREETETEEQAS